MNQVNTPEKLDKYIDDMAGPGMDAVLKDGTWPESYLAWYEMRVLHGMDLKMVDALSLITALRKERTLSERLKMEAICHAGEARGANATINEINQICSGATGEKANWHGAEPVRELKQRLDHALRVTQPGLNHHNVMRDARQYIENDWPKLGDKVKVVGKYAEDWADVEPIVTGMELKHGTIRYTLGETETSGRTDGWYITDFVPPKTEETQS